MTSAAIERNAYNSCAQSALPKMPVARPRRMARKPPAPNFLNTQYFHVVFTLPEQIAAIAYQNKRAVYGILFRATAETLRTIAADPKHLGAEIGFFAVLHSWGSELASSSPPALCRPRRRALSRRHPVDFLPARILLARPGALPSVSSSVPGISCQSL